MMMPDSDFQQRYADVLGEDVPVESVAMAQTLDTLYGALQPPLSLQRSIPVSAADRNPAARGLAWLPQRPGDTIMEFDAVPPIQRTDVAAPKSSHRTRRLLSFGGASAATVAIILLALLVFHSAKGPGSVYTLGPGSLTGLMSISMVTPDEGWAVGGQDWRDDTRGNGTTVLYHYRNGVWTPTYIPIIFPDHPDALYPQLTAVTMAAVDDGWAFGNTNKGSLLAFALHYDGHTWRQVPFVHAGTSSPEKQVIAFFTGAQMISRTDGWVTSSLYPEATQGGTILYHYNGHAWQGVDLGRTCGTIPTSQAPSTFVCGFNGLAMISANEGWAVGMSGGIGGIQNAPTTYQDTRGGIIYHYDHGTWSLQKAVPSVNFQSVTMLSSQEGWALGWQFLAPPPNEVDKPVMYHYHAGDWQPVASPLDTLSVHPAGGGALQVEAPNEGWLSWSSFDYLDRYPTDAYGTLLYNVSTAMFHEKNGTWTPVPLPKLTDRLGYTIEAMQMITPDEGWAVGRALWLPDGRYPDPRHLGVFSTATPLILHFHNGVWEVVLH